jgi:hypothetical protein
MNERILKLARKSGATVNKGFDGTKDFVYGITMSPEELEKFAELIIQECAQVAHNKQYKHSPAHTVGDCATAIKQHFGVES